MYPFQGSALGTAPSVATCFRRLILPRPTRRRRPCRRPGIPPREVASRKGRPKPVAPTDPQKLFQEQGSRLSRAVPYVLHAEAKRQGSSLALSFRNEGGGGAVFHVYDHTHLERIPRRYTVEADRSLTDRWEIASGGSYDMWVLGPNGFVRGFAGSADASEIDVVLAYHALERAIELQFANPNDKPADLSLESRIYGPAATKTIEVSAHGAASLRWDVSASGNWYDLTLQGGQGFVRRFLATARNRRKWRQ